MFNLWESLSAFTRHLTTGLVFVLAAVVLSHFIHSEDLIVKIFLAALGEIGFAFIIAAVFSRTVEKESRDEYNKYIFEREKILSKNIFDYIYSVKIDKKVYNFIEENIYRKPFFRKGIHLEYNFGDEKDGWVLLRQEVEYKVQNISSEAENYFVRYDIEKPLGFDIPNFEKIGVFRIDINNRSLTQEEIDQSDRTAADSELFRKYEYQINLNPGEEASVRIGAHLPKRCIDAEQWRSSLTSDGLSVKVRFDASRYEVQLICVHPNPQAMAFRNDDHQIAAELAEPLLPKNGIYFWWAPKAPMAGSEKPIGEQEAE